MNGGGVQMLRDGLLHTHIDNRVPGLFRWVDVWSHLRADVDEYR